MAEINQISVGGVLYDLSGSGGDGSSVREITKAEYDALSEEEKNNGTVYYITDSNSSSSGLMAYYALTEKPKINGVLLVGDKSSEDLNIKIDVDSALDDTSENPVQNKVITQKLNSLSKIYASVTVATTDFVSDTTYADYPYKASITCEGVTKSYIPIVNLSMSDATSGDISPIAETGTNCVIIYASKVPESDLVIPSIFCVKQDGVAKIVLTVDDTSFNGKTVTCVGEGHSLSGTFSSESKVEFSVEDAGAYQLTCENIIVPVNITSLGGTTNASMHVASSTITVNTTTEDWALTDVLLKKDDETIATSSFSASLSCTFKVYEEGTYTVETNSKSAEVEVTLDEDTAVTVKAVPEVVPFATATDDELVEIVNAYYDDSLSIDDIKAVWSVGDTRNVDLSAMGNSGIANSYSVTETHTAQTVQMVIIDFEHDNLATAINGHSKALLTLNQKDCMKLETNANYQYENSTRDASLGAMNSPRTNDGGWASCARRTWCNNAYKNALPATLKSAVKTVQKLTSAGSQSSTINTTNDDVFLLSEIEVSDSAIYSFAGEGIQYAYFGIDETNIYKNPKTVSSSVGGGHWWVRSPDKSKSDFFCFIHSNGSRVSSESDDVIGLAPAFCL